jgi:hypothetical protein
MNSLRIFLVGAALVGLPTTAVAETLHGTLNGYVFEGHITSEIIKRVLSERPKDLVGLSIPGMPSGVPGMEGPKDGPIKVYAIKKDATTAPYAEQ